MTDAEKYRLLKVKAALRIYDYLSYRDYLRELYEQLKGSAIGYSYSQFAEDLGFSRSNSIWLVITGSRKLTESSASKIEKSLRFQGKELRYFKMLCKFNNAKRPDQREKYLARLIEIRGAGKESITDLNALEYFSEWYHPIIREMVNMDEFQHDPEWIASKLCIKVPLQKIARSLELLKELKLIRFDSKRNRYIQSGGHVRSDRVIEKFAAIKFHETMCDMAKESITQIEVERRDLNSITLCLSEESAMKLSEKFADYCDEIVQYEEQTQVRTQIFQVNLQLFPFTKKS